jgi:hypothetical protein
MGKEIERKFLVKGNAWRATAKGTTYRQGYLNSAKERTVRIRIADSQAFITIKGMTVGATRSEASPNERPRPVAFYQRIANQPQSRATKTVLPSLLIRRYGTLASAVHCARSA